MYLVFDVGGTNTKYALMDDHANIKFKDRFSTIRTSKEEFIRSLEKVVEIYRNEIDSIALSMPGFVNSDTGFMVNGGSLDYIKNWNIVDDLSERFNMKVSVENDAKCAALAEHWKGNIKDYKNCVVIVLGTGVGGAIIINDEIYKGRDLTAGEFSFILSNMDSNKEISDAIGWNISVPNMVKNVSEKLKLNKENSNGEYIFELANNGNEVALEEIRKYMSKLAFLIYNLNFIINPDIFAIGGGISRQSLTYKILLEEIDKIYDSIGFDLKKPDVINCKFFNDANLIGALHNHLKKI
ncbi:ROK family protein [Anaerococcus marasmi]|uniref:ROK family protein n=1 Tax=Anaerococcus marasmi TaxID=2057797 RepID=UPI000CF90ED5|nr:ROK family protein [Anaerococcus marasmi]